MTRILFIAPGDNPHTWKFVSWFGRKYPGEIKLLPYQAPVPDDIVLNVDIIEPVIPQFKIASISSWTEIGRVKKLVHEIKPKILHVLWAYGSGTYGARSDYHPMILSPWGSDITVYPNRPGLKGSIQRRLVLEALKKADYLTATSQFLSDTIHELVPEKDHPKIFSYGIDTSIFDPDRVTEKYKFDWPDDAPSDDTAITVGFFKSLEPTYGPDFLVEAITKAAEDVHGLRCVMAGSGEMADQLKELTKSLGVENRIIFPGRIPYSEMPRALNSIDIFAMPSRYEALGVAALEASAMRKPVIVTKKDGMTEVIEDGITGYFIEEGDVGTLSALIVKLAKNRELRSKLGKSGREFVREKYEYNTIMESFDRWTGELIR